MNIDRIVMAFAGSMIIISLTLSLWHSANWLWLTGFVGANMLQASLTGLCPLASVLRAIGVPGGKAFG